MTPVAGSFLACLVATFPGTIESAWATIQLEENEWKILREVAGEASPDEGGGKPSSLEVDIREERGILDRYEHFSFLGWVD